MRKEQTNHKRVTVLSAIKDSEQYFAEEAPVLPLSLSNVFNKLLFLKTGLHKSDKNVATPKYLHFTKPV